MGMVFQFAAEVPGSGDDGFASFFPVREVNDERANEAKEQDCQDALVICQHKRKPLISGATSVPADGSGLISAKEYDFAAEP